MLVTACGGDTYGLGVCDSGPLARPSSSTSESLMQVNRCPEERMQLGARLASKANRAAPLLQTQADSLASKQECAVLPTMHALSGVGQYA